MRAARFEQRLDFAIEPRTAELIDNALPMFSRVTGERIRHELYLILREREPERVLCRLQELAVLTRIHPRLTCKKETSELFARLRRTIAGGQWDVPSEEDHRPLPRYYLALLAHRMSRPELEALADRLKIYRDDLALLRQLQDLRECEEELDRRELSDREIYHLLRHASTPALMLYWLCTDLEQVRERLWRYESELRHIEPAVDGEYLKGLGLKPSPLFSQLLNAVRDAKLEGQVHTKEEEKALIARLLAKEEGWQDLGKAPIGE
jgi:tRNA nucleotidyltransferase (CCA-adding enzyme)